MKAGASEFLTKPVDDDLLVDAIGDALERSRRALEQAAKMETLRESYASLTRREREVMTLVAAGLLNKQVGGELGISEIPVKAHRGQVMRKCAPPPCRPSCTWPTDWASPPHPSADGEVKTRESLAQEDTAW